MLDGLIFEKLKGKQPDLHSLTFETRARFQTKEKTGTPLSK